MGDAVHTAHFAIGSGTKLAIEDAIELTRQFQLTRRRRRSEIGEVLDTYQELRHVETLRLQNAAWNAMEWFEVCGQRYCDQLPPEQFMYSMLTRSQRISHENLRLRDAAWLGGYERWFAEQAGLRIPGRPGRAAADVHALHPARRDAEEPRRGLAHGAVFGRRRRGGRLPPGAPGRPRHGRRRPGVRRDDLRERRKAASPPAAPASTRPNTPPPGNASPTGFTPTPTPSSPCRSATPAPRPRPAWPGKAPTSRLMKATGRSFRLRPSNTSKA